MKNHLATILFLSLVSPCLSQSMKVINSGSSTNKPNVIARNRIQTEAIYEYSSRKKNADSSLLTMIYYDTAGREMLIRRYEDGQVLITEDTLAYDKENLVLDFLFSPPSKTWSSKEYKYDSAGNEILKTSYTWDTLNVTVERKVYNEKKQLTTLYYKTGRESDFYLYKKYFYNDGGNLIKRESYDKKGELIYSN